MPLLMLFGMIAAFVLCLIPFIYQGRLYVEDRSYTSPFFFVYNVWVFIISLILCTEIKYLSLPRTPLGKYKSIIYKVAVEKFECFNDATIGLSIFYTVISILFILWVIIQNLVLMSTFVITVIITVIICLIKVIYLMAVMFGGLWLAAYLYLKLNALKYHNYNKKKKW